VGKRKVREGCPALAHYIHNFSTSAELMQPARFLPVRASVFTAQGKPERIFPYRERFSIFAATTSACGKEFR
jgi:hypothetical protein